jgi:hypothetical protein
MADRRTEDLIDEIRRRIDKLKKFPQLKKAASSLESRFDADECPDSLFFADLKNAEVEAELLRRRAANCASSAQSQRHSRVREALDQASSMPTNRLERADWVKRVASVANVTPDAVNTFLRRERKTT